MAPPNPASTISLERSKIDFDIDKLNYFIEGSKETSLETQGLMLEIERDPILKIDSNYYEYTKLQHREISARKIAKLATYMEVDMPNYDHFLRRLNLVALCDPQTGTRLAVHLGLFLSAVRGNGTDEQFKYWCFERGAVQIRDVYGCFAMTELAHGSNVAALETTATFDEANKEFIINTPHIGATKWWIGGAAHSSNHAVVYARLIVKGKDYGVKTFVVPLRDVNHDLHPGVAIGDIGAKMGRDGIDNGWIQFSNVRIPKLYMLTKYTRIEDDGEVVVPPLEQLSYGALLGGRVNMVEDSYRMSSRIITIAIRYAVGRKQFGTLDNENQLISYPLHQSRLIPLLAFVYACLCGSARLSADHVKTNLALEQLTSTQDLKSIGIAIESLKNIFGSSASLKSTCTWYTQNLIDECRQACGGHGYSAYSGFGKLYTDWVVQCTWEGDNNVLAMNGGRIVSQSLQKALKGKKVRGDLSYLNNAQNYLEIDGKEFPSNDLDEMLDAYKLVIIRLANHILKSTDPKLDKNLDLFGAEKVSLSKLNAIHYMLETFIQRISQTPDEGNIKPSLVSLAKVFALSQIENYNGIFLQFDIFKASTTLKLSASLKKLYQDLRPKVIGLTDAFKLSDFFINSPLGSYNGDIYNNYYGIVKLRNDPSQDKLPYAAEFLKCLTRDDLSVREKNEKSSLVLKKLSTTKL